MSLLVPWQVRQAVRDFLEWPERRKLAPLRRKIRRHGGGVPVVGFGSVLDDGRAVHGGAVKLLHLRDALPSGEEAFDVLYAVSSSLPLAAFDLFRICTDRGIKIVWNQNGVAYPGWAGRESERFNAPMRRLRDAADFVVYQSEFCKISASNFLGPCDMRSEILYNPVDASVFAPGPKREAASVRLLAAGTHGTRDRVTCVLDALAELRAGGIEAELTVAGQFQWPRGEEDFVAQVSRLGLEKFVRRIERFSQADAPALYRGHHILLHPKYMDPCPTVVLEAMASGLPVVGSRSGGMPEIVPPDCGVLVDAPQGWDTRHTPSGSELATAVAGLLPNLPAAAAAARRNAEERFDVGKWIEAHGRIFQGVSLTSEKSAPNL
ncbi:MAG: glycosyltransferase family 4 protein [Verrucomicrobiae bacterium]